MGESLDEVLRTVTGSLRKTLSAAGSGILVPHPSGVHEVRALDLRRGLLPRSRTLYARARESLDAVLVTGADRVLTIDRDLIAVLPVEPERAGRHLLGVWWTDRDSPPDAEERAVARAMAEQAALLLGRARARQEHDREVVAGERDRIARGLHDVVIQRIFASGLQLRSLRGVDDPAEVRRVLDTAIDDLDLTIRDIRATIFDLRYDRAPRLARDAAGLVREYEQTLGFTPTLLTRGDLDDGVDPVVAENLLASLRELLSNVAQHAGAAACRVELRRDRDRLVLEVSDDGRGIDLESPRSGLRNVELRAALLGGGAAVGRTEERPTVVSWWVPV